MDKKKQKKAKRIDLVRKVKKTSNGVFNNLFDLVLFQLLFWEEFLALKPTHGNISWASYLAENRLADFDKKKIKRTFYYLKSKGYISSIKLKFQEDLMTNQIIKRLSQSIPVYEINRPWDKRVYIITYDVKEKNRKDRNKIRSFLKEIKCKELQKSVYLSIINPKKVIKLFVDQEKISGNILISDLGKDGSIGENPLCELIARVYKLNKLNDKYSYFCAKYKYMTSLNLDEKQKMAFEYFSILTDDPQLPFELLISEWKGDEAYTIFFKNLAGSLVVGNFL